MTHDRRSQARRRLRHSDSYREAVGSVSINKARVAPSSASVLTTVMTNEKLAKIPQAAVVWGNTPPRRSAAVRADMVHFAHDHNLAFDDAPRRLAEAI